MEVWGGCEQEEEELIGTNLDSLVGSNKDAWPEDHQEGKFIGSSGL